MNPDVRAVDLLFHDERVVDNELVRFDFPEMLIIVRPLRPKQMGHPWILGEFTL